MNSDRLTLEEAKRRLTEIIVGADRHIRGRDDESYIAGLTVAKDILARVEHPSEEDRAVIWLMTEFGWAIQRDMANRDWYVYDPKYSVREPKPLSPINDAKKLGWGCGE